MSQSKLSSEEKLLILEDTVRSLWHSQQYLQCYINNLLGFSSEDEFQKEAELFAVEPKKVDIATITDSFTYLKEVLPDIDIVDFFQIGVFDTMVLFEKKGE